MLGPYLREINQRGLILGSGSPRRAELCRLLGLEFNVLESGFAEDSDWSTYLSPEAYVLDYARQKASRIQADSRIVVTADTVVVHKGRVFEKASNSEEAAQMLEQLSGDKHKVITGLVVKGKTLQEVCVTTCVTFDELSEEVIQSYLETEQYKGKAGAYGIQDPAGATFVKEISGCYYNVMGLPLNALAKLLVAEVN